MWLTHKRWDSSSALPIDDLFTISIDFDQFRSISISSDPKFKWGTGSDRRSYILGEIGIVTIPIFHIIICQFWSIFLSSSRSFHQVLMAENFHHQPGWFPTSPQLIELCLRRPMIMNWYLYSTAYLTFMTSNMLEQKLYFPSWLIGFLAIYDN